MRGAKSAKWVTGAIIVALAATACGGGKGDDEAGKGGAVDPNGIFSVELGEPVSGHPALRVSTVRVG